MFSQIRAWLDRIDGELAGQVALLHGKRMFNKEWRSLLEEPCRGRRRVRPGGLAVRSWRTCGRGAAGPGGVVPGP
jgi:hypothetical protein